MQDGIVFDGTKPLLTVLRVDKGLAAEAGVVVADRILSINGFSVETQSGKAQAALCSPSLSPTVIELQRAGRRITVTLPGEP